MPTISAVEQMQADVIAAVQTISTSASPTPFRNDLPSANVFTIFKDIETLGDQIPAVSVLIWDEDLLSSDTNRQIWNSDVNVELLGYIRLNIAEGLIHDLKRIAAGICLTKVNATDSWFIKRPEIHCRRDVLQDSNLGWVSVSFKATVYRQGPTLE